MYILFRDDKFVGFTEDKEIARRCKTERGGPFIIQKIKNISLSKLDIDNNGFSIHELIYYPQFNKVMTSREYDIIRDNVIGLFTQYVRSYTELHHNLHLIKLSKKEKKIIHKHMELLSRIADDLLEPESPVEINEYFNITAILEQILSISATIR